jgi:hypothetical protein
MDNNEDDRKGASFGFRSWPGSGIPPQELVHGPLSARFYDYDLDPELESE